MSGISNILKILQFETNC